MHRDVKPDNIGFLDDGRTGLTMTVLLTTCTLATFATSYLPCTYTMFLGEGRLVLFDFGLAKLWQARHICVCVLEMYLYPFKHGSRLPFLRAYSPTHLLYTLRRRDLTSQQTPHGSSPARPALPVTWRQRWRARGPTARVPRSIPSGYYCGSSHRTSGPSQGWTCSGTRGRWLVPVSGGRHY